MSPQERFAINPAQVAHDVFDGEILAINLDTGTYYSLTGLSCALWLLVADGACVDDIIRNFTNAYSGDPQMIAGAVKDFLGRLCEEGLIAANQNVTTGTPKAIESSEKKPFLPFEISIFTDMQDLLLLDPIHDVEDSGWPLAQRQGSNPAGS